ncbi:hypothetical protein ANO14919_051730 [Xylariales sp. No.14919]|nr:hypothetical protein F5X98DRAFT_153764 [Xylaria grammica]GAW15753.1 hypothetical protein ANO14919_051730 [Xylariales sp. No.14919]
MRLLSSLPVVSLLAAFALADDEADSDLPPPGEPALDYTDGSFIEPNGGTSSYNQGNKMNISWETTYQTTDIYLIAGYEWAAPIQLTTNTAQNWFQWEVATDSTNASEVYVFRAVNGTGTADQKATGGFLSAAFRIPVEESTTPTPTATFSTLTTTATEPAKTADPETTTTPSTTTTSTPNTGISEGTKIGIGVGVGVGVLGLGAFAAAFVFWRRSKGTQQPAPQPYEMPLNGDFPPHFQQSPQPYHNNQQALGGYYKPPGTAQAPGVELDAGQGYHFTPEANPNNTTTRAELQ